MGKGKRYDEPKLNLKKVFGTIITILVIIMIIVTINKILSKEADKIQLEKSKYFPTYVDGKWGVIDNTGKVIIDTKFDEMVAIPNPEKPVFIYAYDVNEETGTYKTKAINEKQEELFKEYERVEAIENYDSKQNIWYENNLIRVYKNGKYGLIDCDGKVILKAEYDEEHNSFPLW